MCFTHLHILGYKKILKVTYNFYIFPWSTILPSSPAKPLSLLALDLYDFYRLFKGLPYRQTELSAMLTAILLNILLRMCRSW